jgi:serine/threonine-protein kinase
VDESGDSLKCVIGRYALFDELASGGMATVHLGRLVGPVGFSRTVAIKRLHPQFAKDVDFVSMFIDEARLAARIRHPNVVPTVDVVKTDTELFLVMEYVHGESLARLMRYSQQREVPVDPRIAATIIAAVSHGLHAAHTATGHRGEPLHIVHRDVSPQNIIVGTDGVPRVFDFGIAKGAGRLQTTREGQIKGKLAYMAPEQLSGASVDAGTDVYATCVVLWEALAGKRLFRAEHEAAMLALVLGGVQDPPSVHNPLVPKVLDEIVMKGLSIHRAKRFGSARELARGLEQSMTLVNAFELGEWVEGLASEPLGHRADCVAEIESRTDIMQMSDNGVPASLSGAHAALEDDILTQPSVTGPHEVVDEAELLDGEEATGISQLSSISVARGVPARRPARRLLLPLLLATLGAAALVAVLLSGGGDEPTAPASTAAAASTAKAAAPATQHLPPVAATSTASPSLAPSTATAASASASASASAAARSKPSTNKAAAPPPPPHRRPTKPRIDCSVPYTLDADGIRIPKRECMR